MHNSAVTVFTALAKLVFVYKPHKLWQRKLPCAVFQTVLFESNQSFNIIKLKNMICKYVIDGMLITSVTLQIK